MESLQFYFSPTPRGRNNMLLLAHNPTSTGSRAMQQPLKLHLSKRSPNHIILDAVLLIQNTDLYYTIHSIRPLYALYDFSICPH